MPTRQDFQRLVEWCDREPPFGWLKNVAGVALAVHSVTPIGTPDPLATGLWTGDLALREVPGISELLEEPVHFVGTLVGVRNPARQAQLSITARVDQAVAKLSGDGIPPAWSSGLGIEHVRDEFGCSRLTGRSGILASEQTRQRGSTFLKCLSCCSGLRFVRTSISAPPDTKREPLHGDQREAEPPSAPGSGGGTPSRVSACEEGSCHVQNHALAALAPVAPPVGVVRPEPRELLKFRGRPVCPAVEGLQPGKEIPRR
jgi:hypothetical protein